MTVDPADLLAERAARHERMFWLDGGGSRPWSGRRSILGFLDDDDVSLTYDAGCREVRRHQGGRADVVGDDVFAVLGDQVARDQGDPDVSWVGYLGYACRPDLPARPAGGCSARRPSATRRWTGTGCSRPSRSRGRRRAV